jgi:CRP/FNR family transcriptional regulator, anaerobic regulatory protein
MIGSNDAAIVSARFAQLGKELLYEISQRSSIVEVEADTELVREGQYIKVVPLVISGLIKVYTRVEEKDLLLYYIQPDQSCIMSFSSCVNHDQSRIFAIAEEKSTVILMPADAIQIWIKEFPQINLLFYQQYDMRYGELVETIHHLLYHKLDQRLMDFLKDRMRITGKDRVDLSHKEIAGELGTAREVVTRLLRKMEKSGDVVQVHDGIELVKR